MDASQSKTMIGACGIDCGSCRIRLASNDPEIAKRLADNFRDNKIIPEATPEIFHCEGCLGKRENHWSASCWILQCCVDEKGLENCRQCSEFPCERLEEWADGKPAYIEALDRLMDMKKLAN